VTLLEASARLNSFEFPMILNELGAAVS